MDRLGPSPREPGQSPLRREVKSCTVDMVKSLVTMRRKRESKSYSLVSSKINTVEPS